MLERTPAVIISRDRASYLLRCVSALARVGCDVHIVDHGSTYPPTVELLESLSVTRSAEVHHLGDGHPRDLWAWHDGELLRSIVGTTQPFIVTDPDVVPDETCPTNWLSVMRAALTTHRDRVKVGLGLRIDDLPEHYAHRDRVIAWEERWWESPVRAVGATLPCYAYAASVDTTLALYRPLGDGPVEFKLDPALRLGSPYVARHLTWYENGANPTQEQDYYRLHAMPRASHWLDPDAYLGED